MSRSLRNLQSKVVLLGAGAGLSACLLLQVGLHVFPSPSESWGWSLLAGALFGGAGAGLLAALQPFVRRLPTQMLRALGAGALLGLLAGGLGWLLLEVLYAGLMPAPEDSMVSNIIIMAAAQVVVLGLVGAAAGAGAALSQGLASPLGRVAKGLRRGGLAGLLAGLPAGALLAWAPQDWMLRSAGYVLWAALLALALSWWDQRQAQRWLRVLMGPDEDFLIPLSTEDQSMGKEEDNDIPLRGHNEVHPYHCELKWLGDHFDIVDTGQGGQIFVNFRQVQSQSLKPGDLVKVGSALLQYGEA